ncbi:PIG-L family deacetylase [Actinosynnema sp. NPDC059335]|uniref:PIG-L family deacetylase n=1 Tax=Actinosynnema sp. NPDC059335 TaxID=3346804 RepID=UPI003671EA83
MRTTRRVGAVTTVLAVILSVLLPTTANAAPPAVSYVNIVAHQDDDILFMNPDLANSITANRPNTTIFLTAGENTYEVGPGQRGNPSLAHCRGAGPIDREDYARCRQLGARAAYAQMAGVADQWSEEIRTVDLGDLTVDVEVHTLVNRPTLRLLFLNLPEHANTSPDVMVPHEGAQYDPDLAGASLYHLWFDERGARTIVPSGTALWPDDIRSWYPDRAVTVEVLWHLLEWLRPTVIRTQDPEADLRYEDPAKLHDHSDHVIGARFAAEAARIYAGPSGRAVVRLAPYRNYNIANMQVNLGAGKRADKAATFAGYDQWDRNTSADPPYTSWNSRMFHRYTTGTTWAGVNQDGRPQVFAVQNGKLVTWWRDDVEQTWKGPQVHQPPGPLAPGISVAANAGGRLQLFARRLDTHEIVTMWQNVINGDLVGWDTLGNPNAGTDFAAQVGTPVAARTSDGRIRVFVKNGGGGLSVKAQTNPEDGFEPQWQDAGGAGLQDGLAVGLDRSGGTDVFGYAVGTDQVGRILHWFATPPDANNTIPPFTLKPAPLTGFEPAGPPSVGHDRDGRQEVFYPLATNNGGDRAGQVGHTWQNPDGSWTGTLESISGQGVLGPPAVSDAPGTGTTDARIMVFTTNNGGGVSTTKQYGAGMGFNPQWSDLGGFVVGQPSAVPDGSGRVHVFTLTDSGGVAFRVQTAASGAASFGPWQTLASP